MDLEKFEKGITSTGFDLEYRVSDLLKNHGWSVINNKYYIDDVQGSVREVDIIAYKISEIEEVYVYTVIIISCKKDKENVWSFLSKEKNLKDPNMNWHPIDTWTNDDIMGYMLKNYNWELDYLNKVKSQDIYSSIIDSKYHVFAFQEMNKNTGSAKNDKTIFASISSLMKAEGYEIESLKNRKTIKCFYNFNLVNVFDGDLLRLIFGGDGVKAEEVDDDKYIGSYIINQKEVTARIHFLKMSVLDGMLKKYDLLHKCNKKFVQEIYDNFFENIMHDTKKVNVFSKRFLACLLWPVNKVFMENDLTCRLGENDLFLYWNRRSNTLELNMWFTNGLEDEVVSLVNNDPELADKTKEALMEHYRYRGKYVYAFSDIPF